MLFINGHFHEGGRSYPFNSRKECMRIILALASEKDWFTPWNAHAYEKGFVRDYGATILLYGLETNDSVVYTRSENRIDPERSPLSIRRIIHC